MSKSSLYEIASRILGLYVLFTATDPFIDLVYALLAVQQAQANPEAFGDLNQMPFAIVALAHLLLVLSLGIFLVFGNRSLAKWICRPDDYSENANLFASKQEVYEIALVIFSLWLVFWTLPEFVFKLKTQIQLVQQDQPTNPYDESYLFIAAIKITLGLLVLFNAPLVSGWLSRRVNQEAAQG